MQRGEERLGKKQWPQLRHDAVARMFGRPGCPIMWFSGGNDNKVQNCPSLRVRRQFQRVPRRVPHVGRRGSPRLGELAR